MLAHPPGQRVAAQPLLSRAKQHPNNQRTGCTAARHSHAWATEGCTSSFGADTSFLSIFLASERFPPQPPTQMLLVFQRAVLTPTSTWNRTSKSCRCPQVPVPLSLTPQGYWDAVGVFSAPPFCTSLLPNLQSFFLSISEPIMWQRIDPVKNKTTQGNPIIS